MAWYRISEEAFNQARRSADMLNGLSVILAHVMDPGRLDIRADELMALLDAATEPLKRALDEAQGAPMFDQAPDAPSTGGA